MGDDVIWLLKPDAVREGIWRMARLPGDCIEGDLIEGEGREGEDMAGGGGGVSLTGDSCGERRELISMATRCGRPLRFLPSPITQPTRDRKYSSTRNYRRWRLRVSYTTARAQLLELLK